MPSIRPIWHEVFGCDARNEVELLVQVSQTMSDALGSTVLNGAGKLAVQRSIIHVAGINMLWRASEKTIRDSLPSHEASSEQTLRFDSVSKSGRQVA